MQSSDFFGPLGSVVSRHLQVSCRNTVRFLSVNGRQTQARKGNERGFSSGILRRRAEQIYQQLDMLQHLRQQARRELLAESRKHRITAKLRQIPYLGPIRSALAVALIQTPHRFRNKRQLWSYSGLGLETRDSGEYHYVQGQVRRRKKQVFIRGLNKDHNHDLKGLFKAAATRASVQPGPFQDFYQRSLAKGIKPTMVRLTLARKIAAITLTLWKKGENFDAEKLKAQAA